MRHSFGPYISGRIPGTIEEELMTDWEKVDKMGQGCQQLGCAITLLVFVVVPLLFIGCSILFAD